MNKNQMNHFKNTFKILTIAILLIMNCLGCGGQINSSENVSSKLEEAVKIGKTSKPKVESVDSNSFVESSMQKDSIIYNQYKDDKKDGLWRAYYQDGNLKSERYYKKGKKEGIAREWWETGKLWTEGIYVNDKANGLMKWHNDEGILVATGNMKEGKRDGKWKICDLHNGSNCIEASFKDDKKIGIWKIYHDNGKLWKEQNWEDGKVVSGKCWDDNGIEIECPFNY